MGSGKTTVSKLIQDLGHPVEYADEVARRVVAPGTDGLAKIAKTFGQRVLERDGSLNRNELGRLVFGDKENLARLEAILHPKIQEEVAEFRAQADRVGHQVGFYDVPLLFEKDLAPNFDSIVCVVTEPTFVVERLKKREGWDEAEIQSRMAHQLSQDVKMAGSQYIIENNSDQDSLRERVEEVVSSLCANPKKNPRKR